jgi:quinolinate synthase
MTTDQITQKIIELKKKRNAVILVHNYQPPEVQDIADFLGDSLDLSRKAAETDADVIVFCGVHFMAETAAILSPQKTVLLPELSAGCPMADMIDAEKLRAFKQKYPGAPVVAYINTTAAVKAETDVCCTSANAEKVVRSITADKIIFVPDKYLGQHVAEKTGKELIFWGGYCPIHGRILGEHIMQEKQQHPEAEVLAHPECTPIVTRLADQVLSTTGMCRYVKESPGTEFIIATETGIIHRMKKDNPGKKFYPATELAECQNMKKTDLEKVLTALEEMKNIVTVSADIRAKAHSSIAKMLEFSRAE